MKNLTTLLLSSLVILAVSQILSAQSLTSPATVMISSTTPNAPLSDRVTLLKRRRFALEQALSSSAPADTEKRALLVDWIRELSNAIDELARGHASFPKGTTPPPAQVVSDDDELTTSASASGQAMTEPVFNLDRPEEGATNEITQLILSWTADKKGPKTYSLTKFIVEIAIDQKTLPNGRYAHPVFVKEVSPSGVTGQKINAPKDTLRTGQKYHWQVFAVFLPNDSQQPRLKVAANAPATFKTEAQMFSGLEKKGITLQRAVTGDDAGEGAQFGFLKTFNKGTVYTADFALIYDHWFPPSQRTSMAFEASVQGNLTSDESQSEDAFQFRAGAIIDRNLKRGTINHLYTSLAAKYETDQKFKVGKLISENMVTPTLPNLHIGIPFGKPSNAVQFRWRPYFYFDVGRTFKKADSAETKDTVLRFTPRVRTVLTLNFLRRALNLNDTFLFADDYLYFLPLETKNRHNMFTSGFAAQVTKDFGFGLTYKKGEAAPKFKPVHTFAGVLTIRFGKED